MNSYLNNAWYMAGWGKDLKDEPVAREFLETPVVIFRDASGAPAALYDMCPHRFAPLARGKLVDGQIQCGYHGLRFNGDGRCTHNPWTGRIPPSAQVRPFPMVERDGILWLWMGDWDKADPDRITRYPELTDEKFRFVFGSSRVNAHYEIVTDNLLDLLHSPYLHPGFGQDWRPEYNCRVEGDIVYSDYLVPPYQGSGFTDILWPQTRGKMVDDFESMRWNPPCILELRIFIGVDGMKVTEGEGFTNIAPHIVTPANETSSHYFWASGIKASESTVTDEAHLELVSQAFDVEDAPMLEAVQRRLGDNTDILARDPRPVALPGDTSAVHARNIVKKLIKQEKQIR